MKKCIFLKDNFSNTLLYFKNANYSFLKYNIADIHLINSIKTFTDILVEKENIVNNVFTSKDRYVLSTMKLYLDNINYYGNRNYILKTLNSLLEMKKEDNESFFQRTKNILFSYYSISEIKKDILYSFFECLEKYYTDKKNYENLLFFSKKNDGKEYFLRENSNENEIYRYDKENNILKENLFYYGKNYYKKYINYVIYSIVIFNILYFFNLYHEENKIKKFIKEETFISYLKDLDLYEFNINKDYCFYEKKFNLYDMFMEFKNFYENKNFYNIEEKLYSFLEERNKNLSIIEKHVCLFFIFDFFKNLEKNKKIDKRNTNFYLLFRKNEEKISNHRKEDFLKNLKIQLPIKIYEKNISLNYYSIYMLIFDNKKVKKEDFELLLKIKDEKNKIDFFSIK